MDDEAESWLIRTPQGWVEPCPPRCSCGSDGHLIGWIACPCGEGPHTGGTAPGYVENVDSQPTWAAPAIVQRGSRANMGAAEIANVRAQVLEGR